MLTQDILSKPNRYCSADFCFRAPEPTHSGWALPRTQANKNITPLRLLAETHQAENGSGYGQTAHSQAAVCKSKVRLQQLCSEASHETSDKSDLKGSRKGIGSDLCSNCSQFL